MYPNHNNYQPNPNQQINGNHNFSKSPQSFNPYSQPQVANQIFISPQGGSFVANRNVYASTIQASTSSSSNSKQNGFGLQSMGRVVKEDNDPIGPRTQEAPTTFSTSTNNNFGLKGGNDRGKLASSVIFQKNYDEDLNRFPGFNVSQTNSAQVGTSRLDALFAKKQLAETKKEEPQQSHQEKRKRQINAIKEELEKLNKRMENTVAKKGDGQSKPYFQLSSRKNAAQNNVQSNPGVSEGDKGSIPFGGSYDAISASTNSSPAPHKDFFQNYARGNNETTNNKIIATTNSSPAPHKDFFQNYARGNNETTSDSSPASNKDFFQNYARGNNETTSNKIIATTESSPAPHKDFFQNYARGNNEATSNKITVTTQAQIQSKTPPPISNPVNNSNIGGAETAMFKKKKLNIIEEPVNANTPKIFILAPKAPVLNNEIKHVEIVETKKAPQPLSQPSFQPSFYTPPQSFYPSSFSQTPPVQKGPKQFKKSDFAIGKKMGKGQFGEVMLVQHKQTGFLCGMKVMSKKQIREQKYVNQIARELSIQFYLNHRNVAPLYGYFQDEENVYLLIEYCTGGQLLQLLRKNNRMEDAETSPIIRQICEGLDYIHKQEIIHRDIKPQNILFNFNTVKICDFGWAVHCGSGMRKTVSGSPLYYSPEIVQETEYDEKVDIWAIGMMTYECLIGKIPFKIYSELDLNRIVEDEVKFPEYVDVTDEAKDFILGIMKKIPEERSVMRDIFKHPFIRKHLNEKKLPSEILEEFRRAIS